MDSTQLNSHFQQLAVDYLYHLGLDSSMDLAAFFGDIQHVVFTRSYGTADYFAATLTKAYYAIDQIELTCHTIAKDERYHIYKIANTLVLSHGVGYPSMLIGLNEVVKLLWHAGCRDFNFFRLGPAGGINIANGSVVIADGALAPNLAMEWRNTEFGQDYVYPAPLDHNLAQHLTSPGYDFPLVQGKVLSTTNFYNGQARLNGALSVNYSLAERDAFLNKAAAAGAIAIDMESNCFAAFCHYFKIPAVAVLAILIDQLHAKDHEPGILCDDLQQPTAVINAASVIINFILNKQVRKQ